MSKRDIIKEIKRCLNGKADYISFKYITVKEIYDLLKKREAVVRCKDCRYWHESETKKGYGDCGQANGIALKEEDWFCADGTPKEE